MEKHLFLIFNHTFTESQKNSATKNLGVGEIIEMPRDIRGTWGRIPPESEKIHDHLAPVRDWLSENGRKGDYVLIQGDFGACCLMVGFAFEMGLVPVYSTTRRVADETAMPDGTVKISHRFRHVIFRRYGQ